jgi:pyridoxal phosphate enzyme (YggS family)
MASEGTDDPGLAARLASIQGRVAAAAQRAGRAAGEVRLVAVGKTFPVQRLAALVAAGQLRLGENRGQEAEGKAPHRPASVEWHLVGHLQSNKAARAARLFHWIHSLDGLPLARRLASAALAAARPLRELAQVDLAGGTASRSGLAPGDLPDFLRQARALPGLDLTGLMTLPPLTATAAAARPYFRRLRELATQMAAAGLLPVPWELSMGMSGDYEVAVEEGATLVRGHQRGASLAGTHHHDPSRLRVHRPFRLGHVLPQVYMPGVPRYNLPGRTAR